VLKNLKTIREEAGITQQELANKAGLSRNTIVNFEKGRRLPRVDDLKRIATALGVTPSVLMQSLDDSNPQEPAREA